MSNETLRYDVLQKYADANRLDYNELCRVFRLAQNMPEKSAYAWIDAAKKKPNNGQIVLALQAWDHDGRQSIIRASWIPAKTEEIVADGVNDDYYDYDEESDTYYVPEGWYEAISHGDEYSGIPVSGAKITHWASLESVNAMLSTSNSLPE